MLASQTPTGPMDRDLGCSKGSMEASGTPTGPMDRDFRTSKSIQERPGRACGTPASVNEPPLGAPSHRQGRWIVIWGASRGSMGVLGHRQRPWIMIWETPRAPKSLQEQLVEPRTLKEAIRHSILTLRQAPREPEPKVFPTSLHRRPHQGERGGMRGAVE